MAKRWTIPFVSRQSKQCRIDIYDPSWSGAVTELSTNNANAPGVAAEDPFYFEEDDDEDLLSVIRVKTGYINLIETTFGGLDDLHPTLMKNRYVEVYYDSTLVFRGYIQQQTFENDWAAAPREVSLPVISPLGLAESLTFEAEMPLTDNKIGYYMKQIIDLLDSSQGTKYGRVTFPQVTNCPEFYGTIRPPSPRVRSLRSRKQSTQRACPTKVIRFTTSWRASATLTDGYATTCPTRYSSPDSTTQATMPTTPSTTWPRQQTSRP